MADTQTAQMTDRALYARITALTWPIILQNLLSAAVTSADVIMLNFVGQAHISAVSLAGQYASVLFMVYYGLGTGATMRHIKLYPHAADVLRALHEKGKGVFLLSNAQAAFTVPDRMMRIFTPDPELIAIGSEYLRTVGVAYLCWGVTEIYLAVLRSVGRVTIATAINTTAFTLNIFLNAVFIFGLFGAPRMGAKGVALATSISRLIELALSLIVSSQSRDVKLHPRCLFSHSKPLFRDFLRMALPALVNDISWGLAFSMYSVIIGQYLGSDMVAANSFVSQVRSFATVLCFSIASAGGILLGHLIGENRMKDADRAAKAIMRLTVLSALAGGILILLTMRPVLAFARLTDTGKRYLRVMLMINSYYIMGAAVNTTLIAGVFRAGGDSRFGMICDTIDMWCYAVPLGFFAAGVLKLPPLWVYFLLCTDEFVKWPWVLSHYKSKKWLKNITRDDLQLE